MLNVHSLLKVFNTIGLILVFGISMSACSRTNWKEEVQLHDGNKIIVERSDVYDFSMGHEIGQGAPLAEHKTTFTIPGTDRSVTWKSDNRSSDPDELHLLVLDFINGVPFIATRPFGHRSQEKWNRPNPPYVFFKFDGMRWQRIPLTEFPEIFKINVIVTGRKKDKPEILEAFKKFGFVPAQIVARINNEPGKSKEYYTILRTPIDYGPKRPEHLGSTAPESNDK